MNPANRSRADFSRPALGPVGHARHRLEQLAHPVPGGDPALPQSDDPAEGQGRPRQQDQVGVERDQAADGHPPGDHLPSTDPQHDERPDAGHHREQRHQHPARPCQAQRTRQVFVVQRTEAGLPPLLQRVVFDDRDTRHVLLDRRRHRAELLLDGAAGLVHLAREQARPDQQERVGEQRPEGQTRRQREQQPQRRRVDERGVEDVEDPRPEQHPHRAEVVGHSRHHVARAVAAVKARIQLGQVPEQIAPQSVFDVAAGIEDEDPRPGPDQPLQHRQHRDQGGVADHDLPGGATGRGQGVDRVFDQPRDREREGVGRGQTGGPRRDAGGLGTNPSGYGVFGNQVGNHEGHHEGLTEAAGSIHDLSRIFPIERVKAQGL